MATFMDIKTSKMILLSNFGKRKFFKSLKNVFGQSIVKITKISIKF